MKRKIKRALIGLLAIVLCIGMLPINILAWSYMSHTNSANIINLEMLSKGSAKTVDMYLLKNDERDIKLSYKIPDEFYRAITQYPEAFRAGALGPDFYPDMVIGQTYIHPYDEDAGVGSGDWLPLLVDSANRLPQNSEGRLEALAFTLGYMLHYCGDMFGHDFVNTFSGGTFPSLTDVDITNFKDPELNNIMSHMAIEAHMDSYVNALFWGTEGMLDIEAPNKFITDSMVLDGNVSAGVNDFYYQFENIESEDSILGGVPIYLDVLVSFRAKVMKVADKFRDNTELITMGISSYADQWAQDIDAAIYGLVDTFDMIAHRLVTKEKNPNIDEETLHDWILEGYPLKEILKDRLDLDEINSEDGSVSIILEELSLWLETYGWKALGIPDVFVDGLPEWMDYITLVFTWPMDVVMAALKTALCAIFAEIIIAAVGSEAKLLIGSVAALKNRFEYANIQLDHEDNPYRPSEVNCIELFGQIDRYFREQNMLQGKDKLSLLLDIDGSHTLDKLVDSDFAAFYNTMVMFKLILMGPTNFNYFFRSQTGIDQTEYTTNTAELEATVLKLVVKTIDQQWSGTDDNVYACVFRVDKNGNIVEPITSKLLDNSLNNDLECGDTNTFYVDLPKPMKLDEIAIIIEQKGTATTDGGWACESIGVTPMHAGVELCYPIGVGGNLYMDEGRIWDLEFQKHLNYHITGGKMTKEMPVTHVAVRIQTGDGSYDSGTDQDVKVEASNSSGYSVKVDLDKYLYDDFEDGDNDVYIVPLGQYNSSTHKNTFPTLGDLNLTLRHHSDYDWYVKNVTVIPYCGTMQLTQSLDFGTFEFKESSDILTISPSKKIDASGTKLTTYTPLKLTYETALDCGLLDDMKSLDAGMQWYGENLPVFWNTEEGKRMFYKIFKGFTPEISLEMDENVISSHEPISMNITFKGVWNGVGEDRRNALAEYAKKTFGDDTYETMPSIDGRVKITYIDSGTKKEVTSKTYEIDGNDNGRLDISAYMLYNTSLPGTYDIRVTLYYPCSYPDWMNGLAEVRTEETFENAVVISASTGKRVRTTANSFVYGKVTGAGIYEKDSLVTITATPEPGYKFVRWEKDGQPLNADASISFYIRNDVSFKAIFEPATYIIDTIKEVNDFTSVEGEGKYSYLETVTLKASAERDQVFVGWYENDVLVSTSDTYTFEVTEDRTLTAKFAKGKKIAIHEPEDCGYEIYPDNFTEEEWDAYTALGQLPAHTLKEKEDGVGKNFYVKSGGVFTFDIDIKDGYRMGEDFAVKATRATTNPLTLTLTADENGKYIVSNIKTDVIITVDGIEKIEYSPKPVISYTESGNSITFTATGEGDVTLYVNNKPVSNPYTLERSSTEEVFAVSATAKVDGKDASEPATINDNSLGSDVAVPVIIADSEHGKVEADAKYDAPGVTTSLTVTPEDGYMLDELTVEYNGTQLEVTELADKYQFVRPSECATVRATFKKAPSFSDVKSGEYYYNPVMWAVQKGITNGTSATTFSPTKACSRAEVVTFLWRAKGSPAPSSSENPFSDVPAGQWYTDAVLWAVERGITTGTGGGKFSPDKVCTRAEVVTFLKRAVAKTTAPSEAENPFADVADGQWYTDAVLWAVEKGITTGTGGNNFSPNVTCDRGQIVTFLYRAVKK